MQAIFDLLLGQHEERDGDEEPRPGAEIEHISATTRQSERVSMNEAQQERNAPGERDKHRRPSAGQERILAEEAQPTLQLKERSAMRGEIVPDPGRFISIDFVDPGVSPPEASSAIGAPFDAPWWRSLMRIASRATGRHRRAAASAQVTTS